VTRVSALWRGGVSSATDAGCLADDGKVALGEPCQRASDDALDVGHDDCEKGAFCSKTGQVDGVRVCRALCTADDQCGDGSACFDAGAVPTAGVCLGTCAMFTEGACPAGSTCRGSGSLDGTSWHMNARCDVSGAEVAGDACTSFQECGDGLGCFAGVCGAYCDKDHACPEGKTCTAFPGPKAAPLDASLGSCK
jgi:hypothetical protein